MKTTGTKHKTKVGKTTGSELPKEKNKKWYRVEFYTDNPKNCLKYLLDVRNTSKIDSVAIWNIETQEAFYKFDSPITK